MLATCPDPAHRDGKKAVENGTIACELTDWKVSAQLDTLAAAYAEAGDFLNAIKLENQAIDSQKNEALLADQKDRLALYQSYRPFHMDKYVPRLQMVIE